jgi:hypothetical protein
VPLLLEKNIPPPKVPANRFEFFVIFVSATSDLTLLFVITQSDKQVDNTVFN